MPMWGWYGAALAASLWVETLILSILLAVGGAASLGGSG